MNLLHTSLCAFRASGGLILGIPSRQKKALNPSSLAEDFFVHLTFNFLPQDTSVLNWPSCTSSFVNCQEEMEGAS